LPGAFVVSISYVHARSKSCAANRLAATQPDDFAEKDQSLAFLQHGSSTRPKGHVYHCQARQKLSHCTESASAISSNSFSHFQPFSAFSAFFQPLPASFSLLQSFPAISSNSFSYQQQLFQQVVVVNKEWGRPDFFCWVI